MTEVKWTPKQARDFLGNYKDEQEARFAMLRGEWKRDHPPPLATVTKAALLSDAARKAFSLAEYRLRHNARYSEWPHDRRWAYCMEKAFEAASVATGVGEDVHVRGHSAVASVDDHFAEKEVTD